MLECNNNLHLFWLQEKERKGEHCRKEGRTSMEKVEQMKEERSVLEDMIEVLRDKVLHCK